MFSGTHAIDTIQDAEPIGPKGLLDVLVIAPCTGNTLAKLTHSIIDTPVTMAAKSHLRRGRPVVLAVSTNDGLSGSAANIGALLNRRHYYFVPFGQDAPEAKPRSLVADMERIPQTVEAALRGEQLQPILSAP
ncbi:MAG: dipicolinate synthase subunit B [Butyricicoccus sp.]|nr:dipicolinate synthase subunit B [Butyricicoccus sp.]